MWVLQVLPFVVEAVSDDGLRRSEAKVIINILDVNDHSPQFQYKVSMFSSRLEIREKLFKNM